MNKTKAKLIGMTKSTLTSLDPSKITPPLLSDDLKKLIKLLVNSKSTSEHATDSNIGIPIYDRK